MELEGDDFAQIVAEAVREFGRVMAKREVAQRVVECVVERVGLLNGDEVPLYFEAYIAEMEVRNVNEALRLESFCQVVALRIRARVKELEEAHD